MLCMGGSTGLNLYSPACPYMALGMNICAISRILPLGLFVGTCGVFKEGKKQEEWDGGR
jgi:hypothetical protein